jgi:lysophospholipase L1-like esterase
MRFFGSQRLRRVGVGLACLALVATGIIMAAPSLAAAPGSELRSVPPTADRDYLALGDSVTFGYREPATTPPPNYLDESTFVGYPEDVGAALDLHVVNAACSGETSLSFLAANVPSNGCENSPGGGPGYRPGFPLHAAYSGTQLQYAVQYLRNHPRTRVVSLMIGANDAFLCQKTTADHCASELPAVLNQISTDVTHILTAIRRDGHYNGQLVILNYYSLNYSDPVANAGAQALNQAMDLAAAPFRASIADGYGLFQTAALHSGQNSCTAGLLTQLSTGGCGVHPSVAGQAVLALAVEQVIKR